MARIGIVTDTTAGVPDDIAAQYGIRAAPLTVNFGRESFRESIDLTYDKFLERLAASKTIPTTAQPSPEEFVRIYNELAADHDSIISINLSTGLSGTVNSAQIAADMVRGERGTNISVVDTKTAWMGTGFMAIAAARAAQRGMGHDEIVRLVEGMIPKMNVLLVVDSLEHLQRGGRIGGAQAMMGMLLQIKPILTVKAGRVEPLEKVRTRRKALERMSDLVAEHVGDKPYSMALGYVGPPDDARQLGEQIRNRLPNVRDVFYGPVTPTVAVHIGAGAVGLIYYAHGEND